MKKDTTQITEVKVIANKLPRTVKSILLESGICPDDFKADRYLKVGAVIIDRNSAHPGMTVTLEKGTPVLLSIYEDRYRLTPVTATEMLETNNDPDKRWSEDAINTSWNQK